MFQNNMSIGIHNIRPAKGSKRGKKRVGRGLGSTGSYSGAGAKGQKSRSGVSGLKRLGAKRLILGTPKLRGFKSLRPRAHVVNVGVLDKHFDGSVPVTMVTMQEKGLIGKGAKRVKILGVGEISHALTIQGCLISDSAKEKITAKGGTIV